MELLKNIEENKSIKDVKGLWIKEDGEIIKNDLRPILQELDKIPIIDYAHRNKYSIEGNQLNYKDPYTEYSKIYVMAGRGCPFQCSFCVNSYLKKILGDKVLRRRSVDNFIEELKEVKKRFKNLTEFFFVDEVFVLDKIWLDEFIDKYKQINVPFQCELYPTTVSEDIVKKLKKAGLINVNMGIQSGSDRVRREVFKRPTPSEKILEATQIFKANKIIPTYDIIVDNPYEKEEDLKESVSFLLKIPRPYNMNIFSLVYFPKTELTERFISDGYISKPDPEKALKQWRMTFDVDRDKVNTFYNCLISLISKSFVPKSLIKLFFKSRYLKKNPKMLVHFVRFSNIAKLGITGIKMTLKGRMTLAKIRYQLTSNKGVSN